jgi:OOP family OmpA-OmpF porin
MLAAGGYEVRAEGPGPFSVSPSLGWYVFDGDQDLENKPTFGLGFGYDLDKTWGLEALLNYVGSESEAGAGDVGAYLLRLEGLYHFLTSDRLRPYFAVGAGAIRFDPDQGDSDTDFLADYGLGAKYFLADNLALRGDARHIISFDDTENNFLFSLGLSYFFGGKKETVAAAAAPKAAAAEVKAAAPVDSDGDGVPDNLDKCPGTPKGVVVDSAGCPRDTDGDGVPDYLDQCPATPAGVKVDAKGCPLDTDGDGVPDYLDKCPDTPKGVKVGASGCPLDTDGDGVFDYLDKCPGTPKGAKVNEVGCWVLGGVQFDTAKWDIKAKYQPNLDEALNVLKMNPGMKVEIQGHTDNRGNKKFNQTLSEKRANAVMEYFLKKGISKDRMSAKGYNFSQPVASNDTEDGRYKNRRVQLNPL